MKVQSWPHRHIGVWPYEVLDQKEYQEEVLFHQDIANNNKEGGYQILFWEVLPYKVPIATQSAMVLPYDMEK